MSKTTIFAAISATLLIAACSPAPQPAPEPMPAPIYMEPTGSKG